MTTRFASMTDDELGRAVELLEVDWPATPELTPGVMEAIRSTPARVVALPLRRSTRVLLIAAAVVLLLAGAAVAARLVFDLGGEVIDVRPGTPTALPSTSPPPLGQEVTLSEARRILGSDVPIPARLGRPDRVWADEVRTDEGLVARVTMAWRPRPNLPAIPGTRFGAVLMRFEDRAESAFKRVWEGTGRIRTMLIRESEAIWVTGTHQLDLLTSEGLVVLRVDGNVLVWDDAPYTMRLETVVPRDEAARIARSAPTGTGGP
jgi:hypothetical protein